MERPYFDETGVHRQMLIFAEATRLQLDRWEPLVASLLLGSVQGRESSGREIWQAQIEHHLCLVAARNLLRALDLLDTPFVVDEPLRSEVIEGRDLHEHWNENMPIFNVRPQTETPKFSSGKRFVQRNPDITPYVWWAFSSKEGPKLLPNVSAFQLRELLDRVEAHVLERSPRLAEFRFPRRDSIWCQSSKDGHWWPCTDNQA